MNIFESGLDVFICLIVFFSGWVFVLITAKHTGLNSGRATVIYVWHSLFAIVFIVLVEQIGGDAKNYFYRAQFESTTLKLGTNIVIFLCYIFSVILNLSYVATSLIFNIFGSLGMIFLDSSMQKSRFKVNNFSKLFARFAIFIPSLSFWTSGIGKDSIVFLGISLAIWSAQAFKHHFLSLLLGITIIFVIRPHIAIVILFALLASFPFYPKLSASLKVFGGLLISFTLVLITPIALNYTGIGEQVSYSTLNSYIEKRANTTLIGDAKVDLTNMNPVYRIINYGFRPTILEAKSSVQFFSAVDNLLLSLAFIVLCFSYAKKTNNLSKNNNQMFLLIYFIMCWSMLALTTANLGLAQRQKWMFMPVMFLILSERQKITPFHSPIGYQNQ